MYLEAWIDRAPAGSTKWASRLLLVVVALIIVPIVFVFTMLVRAAYYFDGWSIATLIGCAGGLLYWIIWTIRD